MLLCAQDELSQKWSRKSSWKNQLILLNKKIGLSFPSGTFFMLQYAYDGPSLKSRGKLAGKNQPRSKKKKKRLSFVVVKRVMLLHAQNLPMSHQNICYINSDATTYLLFLGKLLSPEKNQLRSQNKHIRLSFLLRKRVIVHHAQE